MKKYIFIIALTALSLVSCNKWLTLEPKGEVDATKLLTTLSGYNSALGGVYYMLSSQELYGKNMSYGAMDAMAQYWNLSPNSNHKLHSISKFDYKSTNATTIINAYWKQYYSCISQCNLILESLEKNRDVIENSELIEGEAYALRAFCHMELFKLFGPVIKTKGDLNKKAISYRTKFDVTSLEFISGTEVLNKAEQDLKKAMELMKNDPINNVGRRGDSNLSAMNYSAVLRYRGARMNYYSTMAMLARLEQQRLNKDAAYTYATQLIAAAKTSGVFSLIDKNNLSSPQVFNRDINFSCEMVFSIYGDNLLVNAGIFFGMNDQVIVANENIEIDPTIMVQLKDNLFFKGLDGSASDNRFRFWLVEKADAPGNYSLGKYLKLVQPGYNPEIAIFKLSEAYYIAAEALIGKDNDMAVDLLNTVRATRNLQDIAKPVSDNVLLEYLIREQRKDYFGDGLMFSLYKRLFAPIDVASNIKIEPLDNNFVLPIPDSEYEFSPNPKPTV